MTNLARQILLSLECPFVVVKRGVEQSLLLVNYGLIGIPEVKHPGK